MDSMIFDVNPPLRTKEEWASILNYLVDKLMDYLGTNIKVTKYSISQQNTEDASFNISADVIAKINVLSKIDLCGVLSYCLNVNEVVQIECTLLMYANEKRFFSFDKQNDIFNLSFNEDEWFSRGWIEDEYEEWADYIDEEDWRK
jgi:hypothetical protein